jgi:cytochrome c peroxidase
MPTNVAFGGEVTAVAWTPSGDLLYQTREPAALQLPGGASVVLSAISREDTGHTIFHANAGGGIACASCHPEGGDDARTWTFDLGPRRTQSPRGGILGTEPFHWDGDMADFPTLVVAVFEGRMGGPPLLPDQITALGRWVGALPLLPQSPPPDSAAVARGAQLFADGSGPACNVCHTGPALTNNATIDVGTGGRFQVPSLRGVAWRAPFMHDGRAATLRDRFGPAGGGDRHGFTSPLSPSQIDDLIAYLETL